MQVACMFLYLGFIYTALREKKRVYLSLVIPEKTISFGKAIGTTFYFERFVAPSTKMLIYYR